MLLSCSIEIVTASGNEETHLFNLRALSHDHALNKIQRYFHLAYSKPSMHKARWKRTTVSSDINHQLPTLTVSKNSYNWIL